MLKDIKRIEGSNPGGNCSLQYAPLQNIQSFAPVVNLVAAGNPIFWSLGTWFNIEPVQNKISYDEDEAEDANGPVYNISIKAVVRGDSAELRPLLVEMVQTRKHIVKCRDTAGLTRIVGNAHQQLRFRYKFSTGDNIGALRSYNIEFYGTFTAPAAIIL